MEIEFEFARAVAGVGEAGVRLERGEQRRSEGGFLGGGGGFFLRRVLGGCAETEEQAQAERSLRS